MFLGAIAALVITPPLQAGIEFVEAEVVDRCHYHLSEFGVDPVRDCIERDLAAGRALLALPATDRPLLEACTKSLARGGWAVVKACVDERLPAR